MPRRSPPPLSARAHGLGLHGSLLRACRGKTQGGGETRLCAMNAAFLHREIVSDARRLEALEPSWWELWRRCPSATPFQAPSWLIAWWRNFSPGELAAIAVWRGSRLVGLA